MGRKSRAKHTAKAPAVSAYTNKKEVDRLVQKLINACMVQTSRKDMFESYSEVYFLVERIRQYQNSPKVNAEARMGKLDNFVEWLRENGVSLDSLSLEDYGCGIGIGLKALKHFEKADVLLEIPYALMLTAENAKNSYLADFIHSKRLLLEMPNISLALFLHCEKYNPDSFYKPYIDVLPAEYNTTLYFTPKEMEMLKGTAALYAAITQYKSIARQYGMFYNMMHSDTMTEDVKKISESARNEFTFDAYRWAVSSVSTRLNKVTIQKKGGDHELCGCHHDHIHEHDINSTTFAMIPLWDMMNHSAGEISTNCDPGKEICISYAMKDFDAGEQVTIFYGARDNAAFLIYNGFVAENNQYDKVEIQLGVSPNDKLYKKRVELLEKLMIKPSGSFHIYAISDNLPIAPDLLAFLRVFHMTEEDLDVWNKKDMDRDCLREIFVPSEMNKETDRKIWKFLEDRISLLLRANKSGEENERVLSSPEVTERAKLAVKIQRESRKVLASCLDFCHNFPISPEKYGLHVANRLSDMSAVHASAHKLPRDDEGGGEKIPDSIDFELLKKAVDAKSDECCCSTSNGRIHPDASVMEALKTEIDAIDSSHLKKCCPVDT